MVEKLARIFKKEVIKTFFNRQPIGKSAAYSVHHCIYIMV